MAKYHINAETGDVGPCRAEKGNCPFGGENEHYNTAEGARSAYEKAKLKMELRRDQKLSMATRITRSTWTPWAVPANLSP